jgi:hypothetical protein
MYFVSYSTPVVVAPGAAPVAQPDKTSEILVAIIFVILSIGFFLFVCNWTDELKIAISILDAAADFLSGNGDLLWVPIMFILVMIGVTFVWIFCYVSINSIGIITPDPSKGILGKNIELPVSK